MTSLREVYNEAKRVLKPEFINRFDDLIVFHQLVKADLQQIVDLEVAKLVERLRQKEIKVVLDDKARDSPEEANRIAAILRRATAEILSGK